MDSMNTIDLTNTKHHRLLVLHRAFEKNNAQYWWARCDCGDTTIVRQHGSRLKAKSCGCLKSEKAAERCRVLNLITDKKQYIKDNVAIDKKTGCWNWTSTTFKNGYARTGINGCKGRAYRLSYQEFTGPIKEGNIVCHTCDNPKCVNPDHLFQGTMQDNMTDMVNKGRSLTGEKHHKAKLTKEQVLEIRKRSSESRVSLAAEFGVSDCTIRDIIKRRSWTHIC